MTTSDDDSTQARIIFNDEERNTVMQCILEVEDKSERREALVDMLIDLRQHLGEHGEGWQKVYLELRCLIEWLFKGSETYELALELYEQRFHLRGGCEPAEVLRLFIDQYLGPTPRTEQVVPLTVVAESDSQVLREAAKKRLEIASAAIMGTGPQRIDGMHGCLLADEATLARILSILEET